MRRLPDQKFTRYSQNKERGALSKPQKNYGKQRYLYVESNGQQNQRSTLSSLEQNFKPGSRSMQNSHSQCSNKLKIWRQVKRQEQPEVQQQHLPSLESTTFYAAEPPVPWISQIPIMYFPVPLSIHEGLYSSTHFSYSSGMGADKGDNDTLQQDNWMPYPLVQPIYGSTCDTTSSSPLHPFLEGAEGNAHAIHYEILEFAHDVRPTADVYLQVEAAVECVRKVVKCAWPDKDIEVSLCYLFGIL